MSLFEQFEILPIFQTTFVSTKSFLIFFVSFYIRLKLFLFSYLLVTNVKISLSLFFSSYINKVHIYIFLFYLFVYLNNSLLSTTYSESIENPEIASAIIRIGFYAHYLKTRELDGTSFYGSGDDYPSSLNYSTSFILNTLRRRSNSHLEQSINSFYSNMLVTTPYLGYYWTNDLTSSLELNNEQKAINNILYAINDIRFFTTFH